MFTLADICNIAIQIERNGEKTYREAAEKARNPEAAKLLEMLAEDEAKHAHWFQQMDGNQEIDDKDQGVARMGRELLQEMMAPHTFSLDKEALAAAEHPKDVLRQSIEFEHDTMLFYDMLYGFLDDHDTKRRLERIITEERAHIDKLKEIIACHDETGSCVV